MHWAVAMFIVTLIVALVATVLIALRRGLPSTSTTPPAVQTHQPVTKSPAQQAIMADPSTVTGAAIQGSTASYSDASFLMTAPGTVQAPASCSWQYCNVGTGYTLMLLGSGVLNPTCTAGFHDIGSNSTKITGFTLTKP